ncbi:MAG: VWA domain-containing protein, partial [Bacillota bacterium]|nr:VWA domain-containing protein [Bacillota bacterium]
MKNKFGKSLLAMMLAIMLVVGMTPTTFLGVNVEAATTDKIADNSTIYEWKDYFLDLEEKGTEYAGGVWTDKSVFESGDAFDEALQDIETETGIETDEDNFLIAMSALATNKEVVGYSTIPTDTMFVLDVSQSMDNARSVPDMIDAANEAIDALLSLNKNNRVGIVLYSGRGQTGAAQTSTATLLLGLNRYETGYSGEYISVSGNSDTTVSIANRLRYENGGNVGTASKNTAGGTYIQNGLNIAMNQFLAADPVVEDGNVQTGDVRMPIFVLMSDGAPTHATTSYTNIGTSNMGTGAGSTATAGVGFATQLTAAYAKEKTEDHYGAEAKFYTLGLNLAGTTGQAVATSVMNPDQSTNAINQYWDKLFRDGSVRFTAHNTSGNEQYFNISRADNDMLERDDQYYVDRYFDAGSNDKLKDAFGDIVAEIILQSAYYPTHIESGDRDLGGYVTFSDEIGHFMEVKEMEGILLGKKLFTGETLAKMMAEGEFGNASQFTENGWELVETISARIGVDESTAITLLQNAWRDKQLYYTSNNDYSNYIGWYESEDGKYISFWSQQDGEAANQAAVDNGAKYITKSYGYYGSNAEEGSIIGSDMMHVVVKVRTEIETGLQTVLFEIPASLVP